MTSFAAQEGRIEPDEAAGRIARLRQAIARIEQFARCHSLGGLDWRSLRDEGREPTKPYLILEAAARQQARGAHSPE